MNPTPHHVFSRQTCEGWGRRVFTSGAGGGGGGGGADRAPKNGGGGKGSIDRHHQSVVMNSGIKSGQFFFSPNIWQMMTFLNPLDTLIPKLIFISCRFLGLGHLRGMRVSLGRIVGVPSIEPFGGGGVRPEGSIDPPPPPPPRPEVKPRRHMM